LNELEDVIRKKILRWYQKKGRDFPWRHTKEPYKIMIAEFMLHRTRAQQVLPVYLDFVKSYPDVESLAVALPAEIKEVTKHLGLHWRAQHFLGAVEFVLNTFNGRYPDTEEELLRIPGVGEYIARVILTVCFDKSAPVVDSNIARFINRFYNLNLAGEIRRKKKILEKARILFECNNPGQFLFAIVDFTFMICKPLNPLCDNCYLKGYCGYITEP